jgi:hypothetical protein
MNIKDLKKLISGGCLGVTRAESVLPRYAAMCGLEITAAQLSYADVPCADVPMEIVQRILALDFAERANADLRAMGEGMGKLYVSVPSNINVWGHAKGEAQLASAARALTEAVMTLAK